MKKTLILLSLVLSFSQIASADISCSSTSGTVTRLDRIAPLDSAMFNITGSDVSFNYSSSAYGSTFGNKMKVLKPDSTFYRVQRGFCGLNCLSASSITGYQVLEFEKQGSDLIFADLFIPSQGKSMSKRKIQQAIDTEAYKVNSTVIAKDCQ